MRIREMHLLPDERLAYTSLDTFRRAYMILECEHKQCFVRYRNLMKNVKKVDEFTPKEIKHYVDQFEYCVTNDLMVISLNLN